MASYARDIITAITINNYGKASLWHVRYGMWKIWQCHCANLTDETIYRPTDVSVYATNNIIFL